MYVNVYHLYMNITPLSKARTLQLNSGHTTNVNYKIPDQQQNLHVYKTKNINILHLNFVPPK